MSIFNTRPRFQDRDIRQLSGDTITLSGETNISGIFRYIPGATTGYVLKAIDSNGTVGWQPVSVSADTNTFVTGGTLTGTDLVLEWNTGGSASPIDLSALSDTTYWTAGTSGTGSIRVTNGGGTNATGSYSVAQGLNTTASGNYGSHSEGYLTTANGPSSHSEGYLTTASNEASHAEGFTTTASGPNSHSEGQTTIASARSSHAEGRETTASGVYSHSEGYQSTASGILSHAEGSSTASGTLSHAEGGATTASGSSSHSEGSSTIAGGDYSHAEGENTIASGDRSHSEGFNTIASGARSHAEGYLTTASGYDSHAGGYNSVASGTNSFIHSVDSKISANRSVLLGGQNLTGTTTDTVYVPNLTVRNNHILHSDSTLEVSDIPGTLENIIKGSYTEFNWDGLTTNILSNNNPSGYTSFLLGNLTNFPSTNDYGFVSYYGSGYTRTGSPGTGTDFYRNRLVLKSSSNSEGIIFSNEASKKFWWEIDNKSRMILDDQGRLGLGLNVDGTQDPSEELHVNGNTLISGELTVQTINTGTTVYLLGANSSGTVIQANDIYSDICAFCSSNVSGDTIVGSGTTETESVNSEGNTVDSTSPYSCTQWCAYGTDGVLVNTTTDYETAEKYKLSGLIVRCCDGNSGDGGTDYGTSISGETTTPGGGPPTVITGLTRPFTVRNNRKVSFLNAHKSDVLNSNQVSISDSTLGRIELSTLSSIETSFNSEIYNSNLSNISSSENGFITNSSNASIIGSQYSVLSGVTGSTIIGGNNITGTDNDTVYVPKLNIDTLGGGTSVNNLGIDVNGNVVVGTAGGGGTPEATTATTTTINFTGQTIYYNAGSPGTGNISEDLTGAKLGLIQKIYHNDGTEPTYPVGWVLMGDAIYFTSTLNIIYAEWAGGSRVEYWYVQEQ